LHNFKCETHCKKYDSCSELCDIGEVVTNQDAVNRKELLVNFSEKRPTGSYNESLVKMSAEKDAEIITAVRKIRGMSMLRLKALSGMLLVDCTVRDIAGLNLPKTEDGIYKLIRRRSRFTFGPAV